MKKGMILLLVACVMIGSLGIANALAADKIQIGAAMPVFDDKWLSYLYDGIRTKAAEYPDVEMIMVDANNDSGRQLSQVENFIVQGVDVILIIPVDVETMGQLVKRANDANIPMIVMNRKPSDEVLEKCAAYVGSDSITAGIMQMEWIAEKIGGKGNVCILTGWPGHEAQIMRTKGVHDVVAKYPDIKITREATGKWDRALGMQVMENWLQADPDITAIASNNDEMAIGAIKAAEAAGRLDEIVFGGVDATPDALEFVKEGKLHVTVFQDAYGQGAGGVEDSYKVAKGEPVEKLVWIPYELVTLENVETYVKKWE
ncbi:MAG: sugar ABC transporter substrate-binding protein [Candidatus Vecturithrix sp.]|jgi:inositol transport system substrate-binding protein|nr:sugar ABC transporter substrate-binding protein [Candidatus Vecturithrix sp.]